MTKYLVSIGRRVLESTLIEVEANTPEEAKQRAMDQADDDSHFPMNAAGEMVEERACEWEIENIDSAFVLDCEILPASAPLWTSPQDYL